MARTADNDLSAANYEPLNRDFYRSEPHQYLDHRLGNLLLVAGRDRELRDLLDQGVTLGELSAKRPDDAEPRDAEEDDKSQQAFVALEAELLLHHASETILRLYFAHCGPPPCPWLELSRMRSFETFKTTVRETFLDGERSDRVDDIATVFLISSDCSDLSPEPTAEAWDKTLDNIDRFLVYYANHFLSDAHLYNAAKHGLAVQPGKMGMKLDVPDAPITADGMALQFLEVKDDKWQETVAWVHSDLSAVYIMTAISLIRQLWTVARIRYTDSAETKIQLFDGDPHKVLAEARRDRSSGGIAVQRLSRTLYYHNSSPVEGRA